MKQNLRGVTVLSVVLAAGAMLAACGATTTGGGGSSSAAKPGVKIASEPMKPEEMAAHAVLASGGANPAFSGKVSFSEENGQLHVVADVAGVPPGSHGFHIHENGKCDHDPAGKHFTTAGGHFNPTQAPHGCPDSSQHHAGDLGNIVVGADGTGHLDVTTAMLSLDGPNSVVGKAVILHVGTDDCTSQPVGNAGGRLACGVVLPPGTDASGGTGN